MQCTECSLLEASRPRRSTFFTEEGTARSGRHRGQQIGFSSVCHSAGVPIVQTCSPGVLCDIRRAAQTELRRGSEQVRRCHLEVEDRTALDFAAGQIRAGCSRGGLRRLKDLAEDIMGAADCANEAVCIKTTHSWAENQPAGPSEVRQRARAMRCCADLGRCTRAWGGSLDLGLLPRGGGQRALAGCCARGTAGPCVSSEARRVVL